MFRWIILCVSLILVAPFSVYASDESEGEISASEIESEEALHEQVEALRLRAEVDNEVAEIQAESKREEDKSKAEAQAAEAEFKSKSKSESSSVSNGDGSK